MKKLVLTLVLAVAVAGFCLAGAEIIDRIVAKVNDKIITQGEVDEALASVQVEKEKSGVTNTARELDRKEVLEKLIEERLLLQQAGPLGVQVRDKEVDEAVREIKQRFPNQDLFEQALAREGLSPDEFKNRIRNQIIVKKVVDKQIRSAVEITDDEAAKYYEKHKDELKEPQKVHIRHILIKSGKDKAKALAKAREVQGLLKKGSSFESLAKEYSDDEETRDKGGDLGFISKGMIFPEIEKAAFKGKAGSMAGPVESKLGFHLVQIVEFESEKTKSLDDSIDVEGTSVPIRQYVKNIILTEKVKGKLDDWVKALKEKAIIEMKN